MTPGKSLPLLFLYLVSVIYFSPHLYAQEYPAYGETPIPEKTTELAAVGKSLFFDKRLSRDGSISCATCHREELAFTDGRPIAEGINGKHGTRNTPTLINVAANRSLFWDGRRTTLEGQALDPFTNPREHGLNTTNNVAHIVKNTPEYSMAFSEIFNISIDNITADHVAAAIAAYERTLTSNNSPFDRYYYHNEMNAISASAARGLQIFTGRAKCNRCHTISRNEALFTDHKFHSLGIGFGVISDRLAEITHSIATTRDQIDKAIISDQELSELGRFVVTLRPLDIAKFKTPTLRNIVLTAPYMHDGSVTTLDKAIDIELYYRGISGGRTIILSPQEKDDLINFLHTLTDYRYLNKLP